MTHGFVRITGLTLAVLLVGFGPAWSGADKDRRASGDTPGTPPTGGALNADPTVDGQAKPDVKQPDEPSASPRMETEPGARDHLPSGPNRPAPRTDDTRIQPGARSPRSDGTRNTPDAQAPRRDGGQPQGDMQSPPFNPTPGQPEQPLRSYKQ
jgi:hypothetical protein